MVQVGDILQVVTTLQNEDNNIVQNRWHFRVTDVTGAPDNASVSSDMIGFMTSLFQQIDEEINQQYDALSVKIDRLLYTGGVWEVIENIYNGVWSSPPVFSSTGYPLPPGVAILGRITTGLAKHLGKKFFAGFTVNAQGSGGKVTNAVAAKILLLLADFIAEKVFVAPDWKVRGVILDGTDGTVRLPVAVSTTGVWSYQRRRRTGVGI